LLTAAPEAAGIHNAEVLAAVTGMDENNLVVTALRSVGLFDVLSSTPAGPSVALAKSSQSRWLKAARCAG